SCYHTSKNNRPHRLLPVLYVPFASWLHPAGRNLKKSSSPPPLPVLYEMLLQEWFPGPVAIPCNSFSVLPENHPAWTAVPAQLPHEVRRSDNYIPGKDAVPHRDRYLNGHARDRNND